MRRRGRSFDVVILALAICGACACRRAPDPTSKGGGQPADRLAPGEAPPGTEKAFDLVLPRGSNINGRFADEIDAVVALPAEDVANYVRAQAEDGGNPIVGASGTMFQAMHVKGASRDHHLRVTVTDVGATTRIAVARVEDPAPTQPPPPSKEASDEAMKKAGLAPNGALLDPNHRQ